MSDPEGSLSLAVFDTGPLIYLDALDYVELLPELHHTLVPPAVLRELAVRPGEPGGQIPDSTLIECRTPAPEYVGRVGQEPPALDRGEQESIALALQAEALVVLDDLRARRRARLLRLELTGTLGVLLRLHRLGLSRRDLASDLAILEKAGMYLSGELREAILNARKGQS